MTMDQVQRRRRQCGPKVKTGCGTCKIRRVKCDEARPICTRCSSTGRKCEGYSCDILDTRKALRTIRSTADLMQQISTHISGNTSEKRGFHYFLQNTTVELSGYFDSSFWKKIVLAASAQEPSLKHAVIAIGALHEDFSGKRLKAEVSVADKYDTEFALNQYSKALGALRRSLSSGKQESLTALMSCVLFVCFDSLRGYLESAMVHLHSGLQILRDARRSSADNHTIENDIAPLFTRLSVQSILYVDTMNTPGRTAFANELMEVSVREEIIPDNFVSLEEARDWMNQVANGLFRSFYMYDQTKPVFRQTSESLELFMKYSFQLSCWEKAFERFLLARSSTFSSTQVRGAAMLKVQHATAKIMSGVRPESDFVEEIKRFKLADGPDSFVDYCDFSEDFQMIINLSRSLIATAEQDAKNGKSPLTFSTDVGLIGPLFYLCIKCPIRSIKIAGLELIKRCPRREGMWNSVRMAKMIEEFWEMEAKHEAAQETYVEEFGVPRPVSEAVDMVFEDGMEWVWKWKEPSQRQPRSSRSGSVSPDSFWTDVMSDESILAHFFTSTNLAP